MRYFLTFLCFLSTLATVNAKGEGARTCRIVFASAPEDAPEKLHLFDGSSSQEVELTQLSLSPVYRIPAGKLVVSLLPSPVSNPQQVSPDAPNATISAEAADVYLIVTSDPDNEIAPVKIQVIDAPAKARSIGQMIWLNLTANTVSGTVGSEELILDANASVVLPLPTKKAEQFPVNITFRMPGKDADYPLCETKWFLDGPQHNFFALVMTSDRRTPRVMGFSDKRD